MEKYEVYFVLKGESLNGYVSEGANHIYNPSIRKNRRKESPVCTTCFISTKENDLRVCANQSRDTQNKFFFVMACAHLPPALRASVG